jgi:two-component system nitrogen regulation sensor histidine kinase NtrY
MSSDQLSSAKPARPSVGWRLWRERRSDRYLMGAAYFVATALTIFAIYLGARAPGTGSIGPASHKVLVILLADLAIVLVLAGVTGWQVVRLMASRARDAGARLHLRFVGMFALAAVLPAIVVALFMGLLVNQALESWFKPQVRTVVENSATIARSYVDEQTDTIVGDIKAMATDLDRAAPLFQASPITFGRILEGQAANRYFPAAYVIDQRGAVLASAESGNAPPYVVPPPESIASADDLVGRGPDTQVVVSSFDTADLFRAVYKLRAYDHAYLYVVRRVNKGILSNLRGTSGALQSYRAAERNRRQVQAVFALTYVDTVLLVLVGSIWLGMAAARAISAPVARLVIAADRVAGGDLGARVETDNDAAEIAVLSHAFNRMTTDLQMQQEALRAAGDEAEARRAFMETVLSGVSAGVVGLDGGGRISAANRQALALLDLTAARAIGRKLADVAPELGGIAGEAQRSSAEAEDEIDVTRGDETRRLRVRASKTGEDGLVLTFDDITRLIAAQRSAAWRDVARRIAHEIKNPLTPIQLSAERLRRKYRAEITSDVETFDRCTDTIVRQVGDIGRMVDEFSAFARMPAPLFAAHDVTELLRQTIFAQRVVDPETSVDVVEPVPEVELVCDGRMVSQALINVVKNAGEAIAARRVREPGLKGHIRARLRADGEEVVFEIEDNGVGLPAENRNRLTEPYVTTREKGTGLGLAIVKRILEDHGGELKLTDAEDLPGAKAVLRFPKTKALTEPAPQSAEVV